jgi:hypothetical protein
MISIILKIRSLQFFRILKTIGLIRIILFTVFALPFIIRYFEEVWYLVTVSFLFVAMIHFLRTDKRFIKIAQLSTYKLYALEYGLFLLPTWIFLLLQQEFIGLIISILSAILVACLPYTMNQQSKPLTFVSRWIPAIAFEWKSSFRQYFPFLVVLLLSGFAFSMQELVIPFVIISLSILSMCFYLEAEPLELLRLFQLSPQKLLLHKIKWQLLLFGILVSPLLVLFMILHYTYWYLVLYLLLTSAVTQTFAIFYKYAVYQPQTPSRFNALIYLLFGSAFMGLIAIPFLLPVGVLVMLRYYKKAIKNLQDFL